MEDNELILKTEKTFEEIKHIDEKGELLEFSKVFLTPVSIADAITGKVNH